jgi:hypothetical protein
MAPAACCPHSPSNGIVSVSELSSGLWHDGHNATLLADKAALSTVWRQCEQNDRMGAVILVQNGRRSACEAMRGQPDMYMIVAASQRSGDPEIVCFPIHGRP